MIFSSYVFILAFLPAVLAVTFTLRSASPRLAIVALALASLVFYGYWDWRFVWVILLSIVTNYAVGLTLGRYRGSEGRKWALGTGIAFNIALLGYFKYAGFMVENIEAITGVKIAELNIILPLGISFFTFQQIAYLVDVYRREATEHSFFHYLLFVTFFPQLIAGPIVHHKEMMPQIVHGLRERVNAEMLAQGVAIFFVGVAKKVLIADNVAQFATPVFAASADGVTIPFVEAWGAVLAYTFQIYFDFSAYSDMAIGLGLMFGLRLPINFASPYKATSLVDFWRRWHITLSRFLRDYLYIPLGGNLRGARRTYVNLMSVMLLGGLWHGAAWTFVIWGAMHGLGLAATHHWRRLHGRNPRQEPSSLSGRLVGRAATFIFVVVAWVFFRATDLGSATNILAGMAGLHGVVLPDLYLAKLGSLGPVLINLGVRFEHVELFFGTIQVAWLAGLLVVVMAMPNVLEWAGYFGPNAARTNGPGLLGWQPSAAWAVALAAMSLASLVLMSDAGEFLYYQF